MEELSVLIKRTQEGDKEARRVLIEKNLGLIHHIVKRYLNRGYDAEDLFQIGSIGLMKAVDKFDLSFGVQFSTYAVPMIQGEIRRFLRDDGMVKVSRSIKENSWKIRKAREELGQSMSGEATLAELEKKTGLSQEDIILAMEADTEVESLYRSIFQTDGNEIFLVDKIPVEKNEQEELMNHLLLEQLLDQLEETERKLIRLRYFENMTQVQAAKLLQVSQVQISRMEKRILRKLRVIAME